MRNKKGFTLIELLAVIAILAIVMIIAVPTVLNTIATAKKGAFKDNALSISKAAETLISKNLVEDFPLVASPDNGQVISVPVSKLDFDNKEKWTVAGQVPSYVIIAKINNNYYYYPCITDGTYFIEGVLKTAIKTSDIKDVKSTTPDKLSAKTAILLSDDGTTCTDTTKGTCKSYSITAR